MKIKTGEILIHILGCVTFLALPILFRPGSMENFHLFEDPRALTDFISYILLIGFFYLNFFVFVPTLYFRRKYFFFAGVTVVAFLIIAFFPDSIVPFERMNESFPPPPRPPGGTLFLFEIGNVLFLFLIVFFLSLILRINQRWRQSEKEKLGAELSYLKAQINPHFLFNTLNSVYSLAIEKSDKTASAIIKLSSMMRYVINEAHFPLVSLEKEVNYIRSYIDLQRIRFGDAVSLRFDVNGQIQGLQIAPLILIPFIENAFKYGVNAEENSDIKIIITVSQRTLLMMVSNNKVAVRENDENKSGLGIGNTKSRLHLLYPGRHTLVIEDNQSNFVVSLEMELK